MPNEPTVWELMARAATFGVLLLLAGLFVVATWKRLKKGGDE